MSLSSKPLSSVSDQGNSSLMTRHYAEFQCEGKCVSELSSQHIVNFVASQIVEDIPHADIFFNFMLSKGVSFLSCADSILENIDLRVKSEGKEQSIKTNETISDPQLPPFYSLKYLSKQSSETLQDISHILQITIPFLRTQNKVIHEGKVNQFTGRLKAIDACLKAVDAIRFYGISRLCDLKIKNSVRGNAPFWEKKPAETISNTNANTSKNSVVNEGDSKERVFEAALLASLKSIENDIGSGKFDTAITELKSLPRTSSIYAKGVSEAVPLAFWNLGMAFGRCAVKFQNEVNTVRNRLTKTHSKLLEQAVKALEYSGECIMVAKEFYADEGDKITCDQELLAVFEQHKYLSELLGTIKGKSEHRFLFAEQKVFVNRNFQLLEIGGHEIESAVEIRGRITKERQARRTSAEVDETYNPNPKK